MNDEEKKSIKFLKKMDKKIKKAKDRQMIETFNQINYKTITIELLEEDYNIIETAVNLISKQQKEIEKRDRQIDLMAEWIFENKVKENK